MLALAALLALGAAPADDCARLLGTPLDDAKVTKAETAGGICRVTGLAKGRIGFELWLPNTWNGRYYQLGSGGFSGSIHHPSLAADAARGNAVAATDTGHRADAFDASWAKNNPQAIEDYGHRAIKATSDAARTLITAYYGRPPAHRYFAGCSNGGRQALMAAARYGDDWDGIIAGAPAALWTAQLKTFAVIQYQLRALPENWIPAAKLPAIARGARLCRGAETDDCLTPSQRDSLKVILAAGYDPRGAAIPGNWDRWILNPDSAAPSQLTFADQAARHLLPQPMATAALDVPADGLHHYKGRLIVYFGLADAVIAPGPYLAWHRTAAPSGARLVLVPGMLHCQGGIGPTSFGQSLEAPSLRDDPAHDIRRALEAWVERGRTVKLLIARDARGATRRLEARP